MRIEQYIQIIDYALWEFIKNGATLPKIAIVEGVEKVMPITFAKEKTQRRLEVKARSTLMMGIPNEHQLKFNSIKDAKLLLEAVEKRFGFKKLGIQYGALDENLSQEDVKQKLLRSLSPEWNIHAVVWRNKADLDTMSMDDLYNNLKVTSRTNEAINTAHRVFSANTQVNAANMDNLSDAVICAFLASQPNSPQLAHEDLQQIHPNDIEEMDLRLGKWTFHSGKCYNCHKRGHFARECRALRNQDYMNKESSRRIIGEYKVNAAEGVNAASEEVSTADRINKWYQSLFLGETLLEDMDQDSAHMVAASKVFMLKPSKFELWRIRIEQYIQMIDYALWEVIENGATLPKIFVVKGVEKVMPITFAKDKARRRLEVKARSTLMMGILNEHQLKSNSIKDAKLLLEAVEKRFGRNATTKKTQRNLLKQQYENFTALSSEMLDQTFDWLQKLMTDLDTMSMDDLYNNLKVYEPEVKGMSSLSLSTQNMAFVSSSNNNSSSTNEAVNTAHGVSTASTQVNAANSTNIDNLSDAVICGLYWQKIIVNGNETIGFDKFKVECYNCHKRGHFARKCRALRNQDNKNKESSRRSVPVETSTSTALVSCDGLGGYDWSDQAEEGPNYALMAYSSLSSNSEVSNDSNCSKSCMETVKLLKSQNDQLLRDLEKSSLMVLGYKTGLESVEEKLEFYKKNESVYVENINGLKWDIQVGEITIRELRKKLEKIQKEKDSIQFNVDKFENASKSLNKLIECQIVDNCKKGLGYEKYNAVPPPYTGNFMPPTPDLSFTGLDEFVNKPVVENRKSDEEVSKVVRKSDDSPIIEDWVSDSEEENVSQTKTEKKTVKPSIAKIEFVKPKQQEKTARKTVKQVEKHRQNTHSPRGNQRNWNNMMSQKLGSNFEMFNKACYVCGSFDHLQVDCNYHQKQFQNQRMVKPVWNNAQRVNHQNFAKKTHPCAKKNMVPRAVLMKSGLVSARPMSYLSKITHSTVKRPIHKNTAFKNSNINQRVNTVRGKKINTARPKAVVNAVKGNNKQPKAVVNVVQGNNVNAVKASACWVWKPKTKVLDHGNPQMDLQDKGVIDSGCSRHMIGNMSYLPGEYERLIERDILLLEGTPKEGKSQENDETSGNLKSFITKIENLVDHKVKVIRCDNGTEFKNREMNQFCEIKGILRQFSVARTPQQNGVAKRRNRTLIEATRTMLADSKLPTTFWAEAINTACYVQNRVLVVKSHNKTPYEIFHGRTPTLSFMRLFRCPVTILNTIDHLGKFDGKADEGFFVRYSLNSKAFRVFNSRTRIVEENLHISAAKVLADAAKKNVNTYTRRRRAVSTGSEGVSTASRIFSTAGASMPVSTAGMVQQKIVYLAYALMYATYTFNWIQLSGPSEMRRASKGYTRVDIPLFPTMLVQGLILQCEGSTVPVESHHAPSGAPTTSQPPLSSPSKIPTRQETEVPLPSSPTYTNVADKDAFISMDVVHGGAATTVSSIDAGQGSGNIPKSPTMPHDSPLPGGHTPGSDEGGRMIEDIDQDARISLVTPTKVSSQEDQYEDQLGVLSAAKVLADGTKKNVNTYTRRRRAVSTGNEGVSTASRIFSTAEESVSTAGASMPVSTAGMVQQVNIIIPSSSETTETTKDKGKAIMQESEQPKKIKKRVQIQMSLDEELAQKLHEEEQARFNAEQEAKFNAEQEELLASETTKDEANPPVADIDWDDVQAQIQADEDLAQKLLEEERENLSIEERARLLAELIDKRKKLQAAQRYEAIRNKPQTMSQQRKTMCTYMKNMAGYKMEHFKGKSFYEVKEMFDNVYKQVTSFVPMDSVMEKERTKRAVPVEEVYVEALQVKYPIIEKEVYSEDTRKYWKIIRVGNHTEAYQTFDDMLKKFDRDDLDKLWSLVKERFGSTDPTDDKERTLWVELKRLFEPDTDDILGHDIFLLVEKDYPLTRGLLTLMMCNKLQVDQYSEMADELLRKIVILANKLRQ
ncbi:ribonuclease H-like domain-containing protein [Tanacetum coccineum]